MSNPTESLPDRITLTEGYSGRTGGRLTGERWTVGPARLTKISVGEMDNNVYVIESTSTGEVLLVDAANDAPQLVSHLRKEAPGVKEVLTTHLHADHVGWNLAYEGDTPHPRFANARYLVPAADWARRLASGEGFDAAAERLVDVSQVLDRIYQR